MALAPATFGRGVAFVNTGAQLCQTIRSGAQLYVGTADFVSQIEQHLGDTAHTDSADSHEVEVL